MNHACTRVLVSILGYRFLGFFRDPSGESFGSPPVNSDSSRLSKIWLCLCAFRNVVRCFLGFGEGWPENDACILVYVFSSG